MNIIRIVHLSDLHFSKKKDKQIWNRVVNYINNDVQPDAILISGDVTDNATEDEFEIAFDSLSHLRSKNIQAGQPHYRIVPGNHDRFEFHGNNWIPFRKKKESHLNLIKKYYKYKSNLFEKYFSGYYPNSDSAADIVLANKDNNWHVRVIGIDSNDPTSWFAQGSVRETDADKVKYTALADTHSDLVIALVHHHLLPIPDVERKANGRGLANVANFTGMLNAGVLLNYLSAAQVNIVLHGHEHTKHLARFSGSTLFSGTTAILSAGSGTGEDIVNGWAFDRIHFNVLELEGNRSVFLREVHAADAGLSLKDRQLLLTATDIRKARFVRRNRTQDGYEQKRELPTSRVKKLFLLETDRSATVTESRTDIASKREWSITTKNASGHLDDLAEIEVFFRSGRVQDYDVPFVTSEDGDPEGFTCGLPLDRKNQVSLLNRTTARWRWAGAALLCKSDARLLPVTALRGLRQEGREFVGLRIEANEEYEQASITLSVPPEYSPMPTEFRVDYEDINRPNGYNYSEELTSALEFCGSGHVELRIPFPNPACCYYLSWPLLSDDNDYAKTRKWIKSIQSRADNFQKEALSLIGAVLSEEMIRVTLYAHVYADDLLLTRLSGDDGGPPQLTLLDPRSRARTALFGELQVIGSNQHDARDYLLRDELLLLFVPIEVTQNSGSQHPALLRVAAKAESGLKFNREEPLSRPVSDFIGAAYLAAENIAWLARSDEEQDT